MFVNRLSALVSAPAVRTTSLPLLLVCLFLLNPASLLAQLTPEHRRDLATIRRDVTKVTTLARQKKFEEAEEVLSKAEESLKEIMTAANMTENDAAISSIAKVIENQRKQYERIKDPVAAKKNEGVSFSKEIAPILAENCVRCHSNDPRGGLRLDTFAGMKRGGTNGPLLIPGNARRSHLALRLVAPGQQRMPRGEDPLSPAEINKIAEWINQGARYDHDDENTPMASLSTSAMKDDKPKPEIKIAKPEGNETVSFKEDIAPMLVTFCLRCHSGANPASGFSVENFEKILIGGESGEVLLPGKLEDSRLFRLTGGLENPRMPRGEARITRKNYEDLKAWITEGLKYDVEDPKMLLTQMVPTEEEKAAARLANMSDDDFKKHRQERAEQHWKRTLSNAQTQTVTSDRFLVVGNVEQSRLEEVAKFAEATSKEVQQAFGLKSLPSWRGRLAIYVFKDQYDYEEFNRSIENRETGGAMFGHGQVTAQFDNAYIALLDTGDSSSSTKPALKWTLFKSMSSAYMQSNAKAKPMWLLEGAGWALADSSLRSEEFERTMISSAVSVLGGVRRPEDLFQNGTFAPAVTEQVGFLISRFLLKSGSPAQFRQFAAQVLDGRDLNEACRSAYKSSSVELIQGLRRGLQ